MDSLIISNLNSDLGSQIFKHYLSFYLKLQLKCCFSFTFTLIMLNNIKICIVV